MKEDSESTYVEPPMSPVFKGGRFQTSRKRGAEQGAGDEVESEDEESQSVLKRRLR